MPFVPASSLASNVAQVRPIVQSLPSVAGPTASSSSSQPVMRYQNVNVNVNGVVKNLLIPVNTELAASDLTPSKPPVDSRTPTDSPKVLSVTPELQQQVITKGPASGALDTSLVGSDVAGPKVINITPPLPATGTRPKGISLLAQQKLKQKLATSSSTTTIVRIPDNQQQQQQQQLGRQVTRAPSTSTGSGSLFLRMPQPGGPPDKYQYFFVQTSPSTQASQSGSCVTSSSSHTATVANVTTNAKLKAFPTTAQGPVTNQRKTTVVYPGRMPFAYEKADTTSSIQPTAPVASNLKIGSVFSLTDKDIMSSPSTPTGFIDIKPEPDDIYEPPCSGSQAPRPSLREQLMVPLEGQPKARNRNPSGEDFVVLGEWEVDAESTSEKPASQSSRSDRSDQPRIEEEQSEYGTKRKAAGPLGPLSIKKKLLRCREKGAPMVFPRIRFSKPQGLYTIKRTTVSLERLDCFLDDPEKFFREKTVVRASDVERKVKKARKLRLRRDLRRLQKRGKGASTARQESKSEEYITEQLGDRLVFQQRGNKIVLQQQADKAEGGFATSSGGQASLRSNAQKAVTPILTLPQKAAKPKSVLDSSPTEKGRVTSKSFPWVGGMTQPASSVTVDARKFLMVKTAAGSFLVPVTPGATAIKASSPHSSVAAPSAGIKSEQPKPVTAAVERREGSAEQKDARGASSDYTTVVDERDGPPKVGISPEQKLSRAERIKLLRERLKKQEEETKSAHRLHEESKNTLETIDLI